MRTPDPRLVLGGAGAFAGAAPRSPRRARAAAQADVALAEREGIEAALAAQLAQRRSAVEAAAARVRAFGEDVLPELEASLDELTRAFEIGEIDLLTLSFAVERFLAAQREALEARADHAVAVSALEVTLGGPVWARGR